VIWDGWDCHHRGEIRCDDDDEDGGGGAGLSC